jgi:hypothetical protein
VYFQEAAVITVELVDAGLAQATKRKRPEMPLGVSHALQPMRLSAMFRQLTLESVA